MNLEDFKNELGKLGIIVTDEKIKLLNRYYDLLIEYNEKINLTAITEKKDVYLKHFYDSLTLCKAINFNEIESMCDIGTGAGFPGIVIKIFYPHLKITLVDALNKRINFLNVVVSELGLKDVTLVHARAEEFAKDNRDSFDLVTARAVAKLSILMEYSMPMVKINKYFVAMKGHDDVVVSNKALDVLGSKVLKVISFDLPNDAGVRNLVLVQKEKNISLKYPRRYSDIKKKPLQAFFM